MGLKAEAADSCARAAAMLQAFLQAHAIDENHPADKMQPGEIANLERCYVTMIPLFAKLGGAQADRVMTYGQQYLDLFPNGKDRQKILNCMNGAKTELGSAPKDAVAPAAEVPAAEGVKDAPVEAEAPAAGAATEKSEIEAEGDKE